MFSNIQHVKKVYILMCFVLLFATIMSAWVSVVSILNT